MAKKLKSRKKFWWLRRKPRTEVGKAFWRYWLRNRGLPPKYSLWYWEGWPELRKGFLAGARWAKKQK